MPRTRVRYWNVPGRAPKAATEESVRAGVLKSEIHGFGEGGHLIRQGVLDRLVPDGFTACALWPQVPIVWRDRRYILRHESRTFVSPDTPVGKPGAGPATMNEKWSNTVRLEDKQTGLVWSVSTFHAVPSIQIEVRDELHERQMAALRDLVQREAVLADVALVIGDMNAVPTHPNMGIMRRGGLVLDSDPDDGTHGGTEAQERAIDHVWRIGAPAGFEVLRRGTEPGILEDDHDKVIVVYGTTKAV